MLPACSQLVGCQHLGKHVRPVLGRMDLRQHEFSFFYSLLDPMIPLLDMLCPGVVGRVLRKVDGTLTVAIELVFLLSDTELTDEVLHP